MFQGPQPIHQLVKSAFLILPFFSLIFIIWQLYSLVNDDVAFQVQGLCSYVSQLGELFPSLNGTRISNFEDLPAMNASSSNSLLSLKASEVLTRHVQRVRHRYSESVIACNQLKQNPYNKYALSLLFNNVPRIVNFRPIGGMGDRMRGIVGSYLISVVTDSLFIRSDNVPVSMLRFVEPLSKDIWYYEKDILAAENVQFKSLSYQLIDSNPRWIPLSFRFEQECLDETCPPSVYQSCAQSLSKPFHQFPKLFITFFSNEMWTVGLKENPMLERTMKAYGLSNLNVNQLNYLSMAILFGAPTMRLKAIQESLYETVKQRTGYHPAQPKRASIVNTKVREETETINADTRLFTFDVAVHLRVGTNTDFGEVAPRLPQFAWREMAARAALQCASVQASMIYEADKRPCLVLVMGDSSRAINNTLSYLNRIPDIVAVTTSGVLSHWDHNQNELPGEKLDSLNEQEKMEHLSLGHQRTMLDYYEMARDSAFIVASRSQLSKFAANAAGVPGVTYIGIQPGSKTMKIKDKTMANQFNVFDLEPVANDVADEEHDLLLDLRGEDKEGKPLRPFRGAFHWNDYYF